MSRLRVYSDSDATRIQSETDCGEQIATLLAGVGVRFERWPTVAELRAGADPETVLAAYAEPIAKLKHAEGYQAVDVVSLAPEHPQRDQLRQKFLNEHTHAEDEVRFFVDGQGLFSLHINDCVYEVLCHRGDLISVPAGTRHWFDMGPAPSFVAIRLFTNPEGWVAQFTGDDIAERYPRLAA